ncbi:hypothetical protein [Terrimonas alba]|uniref:hypothetical protein n=1 Tax=Terrimonas alba TaxID=3349636 RepID=UPI0035F37C80
MLNKKLIKILTALTLFIALTLVYTFAQKGKAGDVEQSVKEEKNNEEVEKTGTPTGDDPWKEMDKLVNVYYGASGITYKGLVKLIDDNGDQEKVMEEHGFEYAFSGNNFQYSLDSMEFVSQDKYIVAIDHRSRLITLSAAGKQQAGTRLFDMEEFKKIMQEQKANAEVTQSGNEKMLTIDNIQHPQIQGYRIYYDPKTYKINKMLIGVLRLSPLTDEEENYIEDNSPVANGSPAKEAETNEAGTEEETEIDAYSYYVEIIYRERHELSAGEKGFNPVQKFVKISKDKVELQPAFLTYQLLSTTGQTE